MPVAFDSVGPSSSGFGQGAGTSATWTHTTVGAPTSVFVGIAPDDVPTSSPSTATLGGTSMTSIGIVASGPGGTTGYLQVFRLDNVAAGAHTIVVTMPAGTADSTGGSLAFTGVTGIGTVATASTGLATTAPITVPASTAGNIIAAFCGAGDAINSVSSPATSRFVNNFKGNAGNATGNAAGATSAAGGSVTVTFNLASSTDGATIGFEVQGSLGTSPPLGLIPPGLQSPMVLAEPPRFSIPPAPQQQPAPAPQLIPPGLQSPMSLAEPPRPATQAPPAPPAPPTGTPAPAPIPPGLQSPMTLAVPPRYSQPAPPQQQPAPAPQLIPPGLQSPMSLAVPPRPATSAPPPPPVTAVSIPPPLLTPPGLQSPMVLAVPARPATAAPPAPPPAVSPGTAQVHPPGRMSPMSIGLPLVQPPQGAPPPGPPPPTPPIPSGVIFGGQAAGGDRDHEIRVFRSIMPGEIPATGAELPKLQGRAWAGPLPERADDTLHDWLEEQAPPEPGPGVAEIARDEAERLARGLYELGRIIAPEPYTAPGKGKCGQPRKIGREWLTCKLRAGHGGMHSDRGVRWG